MAKKFTTTTDLTDTVIARDIHIKGDLRCDNDVWIDGRIDGDIATDGSVVLAQNSQVVGGIRARTVQVGGLVTGDVTAKEVIVCEPTAQITGKLTAPAMSVATGAFLRGEVSMPEIAQDEEE